MSTRSFKIWHLWNRHVETQVQILWVPLNQSQMEHNRGYVFVEFYVWSRQFYQRDHDNIILSKIMVVLCWPYMITITWFLMPDIRPIERDPRQIVRKLAQN